jgi:anti-sigma regulatory factor (Ser/Thr protein kinase)
MMRAAKMGAASSRHLPGSEDGLRAARACLDEFSAAQGLSAGQVWPFQVALDEVLSNIVRHGGRGAAGPPRIELRLRLAGDSLEMVVVDDASPFNPLEMPPPPLDRPLEGREPGGLGIALVRRLMDVVEYERTGEKNRLLMRRRMAAG